MWETLTLQWPGFVGQSIEGKRVSQRAQKFSGGFLAGLLQGLAMNGPGGDHGLRAEGKSHGHAALEDFRVTAEPEFRNNSGCLRHSLRSQKGHT